MPVRLMAGIIAGSTSNHGRSGLFARLRTHALGQAIRMISVESAAAGLRQSQSVAAVRATVCGRACVLLLVYC